MATALDHRAAPIAGEPELDHDAIGFKDSVVTGIACAVYYRRELTKSAKNFLFIGVAPCVGALILLYLLVRSASDLADPEVSYTGGSILGLGVPLVIAAAFMGAGLVILVHWRLGGHERFFGRKAFEAADSA
jgi:hypothetical protein